MLHKFSLKRNLGQTEAFRLSEGCESWLGCVGSIVLNESVCARAGVDDSSRILHYGAPVLGTFRESLL